jgi:YfiH family protein
MTVIRPLICGQVPGVLAALSTRRGGVSGEGFGMNLSFSVGDSEASVRENRRIFFGGLGIKEEELAIPRQIHGAASCRVDAPGIYTDCDALMTSTFRVFLCISFADCLPVFLCGPEGRAIAAVHAGWRGTAAGIVARSVDTFCGVFAVSPADIVAYIGPAAGACCYAVGEDVAAGFSPAVVRRDQSATFLDLKGANRLQLLDAGLQPDQIEVSPHCTIEESAIFHSHRRDGVRSGRMMAVIGITEPGRR